MLVRIVNAKELVNTTGGLQSILTKDAFGENALHLSSKVRLVGAMKILIEKGDIQAVLSKNNDDENPLHCVCRNAQFSALELLIRFGEIDAKIAVVKLPYFLQLLMERILM